MQSLQFLLLCCLVSALACPPECTCAWKNGKQFVDCSVKQLTTIPELTSTTQILEFSGNNLQTLPKDTFLRLGIVNLLKISLRRCNLQNIDDHAFRRLSLLIELDLSDNYITTVPSANFIYLPKLRFLILSKNPIKTIKTQSYKEIPSLVTLELINCEIESIENEAFVGLNRLRSLRLSGNRLSKLNATILPNVDELILYDNNWVCNCDVRGLRDKLLHYPAPRGMEPVCMFPETLINRTISSLINDDLDC